MIFYLAKSYRILTILEYVGTAKEDASNTEIWRNTFEGLQHSKIQTAKKLWRGRHIREVFTLSRV